MRGTLYPGAMAVLRAAEEVPKERKNARAIVRKTVIDQMAEKSAEILADPEMPARYEIDLAKQAILGRLKGLLPNENLATLEDATKLGTGVVLARAMAVQDAAAFNLWAANAMIESAKIAGLVADKIEAGTINVRVALVTGGAIEAGGMKMDDGGGELLETADDLTPPQDGASSKLTNSPDPARSMPIFGALGYYSLPGSGQADPRRGAQLRADGDGSYRRGQVRLDALGNPGGALGGPRHAFVVAQGGYDGSTDETKVRIGPYLDVGGPLKADGAIRTPTALQVGPVGNLKFLANADGRVVATGNLETSSAVTAEGSVRAKEGLFVGPAGGPFPATIANSGRVDANKLILSPSGQGGELQIPYRSVARQINAGASSTFAHGLGRLPDHVQAFWLSAPGVWKDVETAPNILLSDITDTGIVVVNSTAAAQSIRVTAF